MFATHFSLSFTYYHLSHIHLQMLNAFLTLESQELYSHILYTEYTVLLIYLDELV